jgi:hypothetical protein
MPRFAYLALAAALLAGASAAGTALAQHKHAHGQAELDVAVDGGTITLSLKSPLESLVGFERAPKTDAERQRVGDMAKMLRSGAHFVPTAAARCTLAKVELASDVLAAELLGEAGKPAAPPKAGDGHADLAGTFVYRCENAAALQGLDVTLFDAFKRLRRIDVQLAGPKGQSKLRLTSNKRQIRW